MIEKEDGIQANGDVLTSRKCTDTSASLHIDLTSPIQCSLFTSSIWNIVLHYAKEARGPMIFTSNTCTS